MLRSATRRRALGVLTLALAAAAVLPGRAAAHAGLTAPVATSFAARLASAPPGVEARIVDGDQVLWLRVRPTLTLEVAGFQGEPFLRFSRAGVAVNRRSPAYYLDRGRPAAVPRGVDPRGPPSWHLLSAGHTYSWHEDRLHALAVAARGPGSELAGRWVVPVVAAGRHAEIRGTLLHAEDPSLVWFWPIAVVVLSLVALLRLRRSRLDAYAGAALVGGTLLAFLVGRLGRDLYGRPDVTAGQLASLGVTVALVLAAAVLYARGTDSRAIVALLVGVAGLYEGLSLLGVLLHGFVLAALPAAVERAAATACLAGGAGVVLIVLASDAFAGEAGRRGVSARMGRRGYLGGRSSR